MRRQKMSNKSSLITDKQEEALWRHAFNLTDPRGLQRAVVYVLHKTFILRGGSELSNFSLADLTMKELGDDWVVFTVHLSGTQIKEPSAGATVSEQRAKDGGPHLQN